MKSNLFINYFALLLCISILFTSLKSKSADIKIDISQETLSNYSRTIKQPTGTGVYTIYRQLPHCLRCSSPQGQGAQCKSYDTSPCRLPIMSINWSWKITNPRFVVTENGMKFLVFIETQGGGAPVMVRQIELFSELRYRPESRNLDLFISNEFIPISLNWGGSMIQVDQIQPGFYYNTQLPIKTLRFQTPIRALTGNPDAITVRNLQGKVEVSSNVSFY